MSKKTKVIAHRLVFKVAGQDRSGISMYERTNGDVIVVTKSNPIHADGPQGRRGARIKGKYFSIHKSAQSKDNINVLKQTIEFEGLPKAENYCMTSVIKSGVNFCPLFSRLFPDLSSSYWAPSDKPSNPIILCEYDPKQQTPMVIALVAAPGKVFTFPQKVDFEKTEIHFNFCSVIALWKLLNFPSERAGTLQPSMTYNPNIFGGHIPYAPSVTAHKGGNENRIIEYFGMIRSQFEDHLGGKRRMSAAPSATIWKDPP